MNSKQFLIVGGIVLVLVGVLGAIGVIGPTARESLFGPTWWFDSAENWAHLVLGIVAVAAAFVLPANIQKPLVILVGLFVLVVGIYSLTGSVNLLGANLENPADTLLHIVVGLWGLAAALMGTHEDSMSNSPMPMSS